MESDKKNPKSIRKNIGFLANDLDDEYCKSLCAGAARAAEELDCNLYVYSGRYFDAGIASQRMGPYTFQYNTVFGYATSEQVDALIVCIGTLDVGESRREIQRFLNSIGNIPAVFIGQRRDGCGSVFFNQYAAMSNVVSHLICHHGCKKIGFVSGPQGNPESIERKLAYRDTLESHGIQYDPEIVVRGDFTPHLTEPMEELIAKNPDLDAICFANDLMAGASYPILRKYGKEPGVDVLVTGYDNSIPASSMYPQLTTVAADPTCLGYSAVKEALAEACGKEPEDIGIECTFMPRASCGCGITAAVGGAEYLGAISDPEKFIDSVIRDIPEYSHLGVIADSVRETLVSVARCAFGNETENPRDIIEKFRNILCSRTNDSLICRSILRILESVRNALCARIDDFAEQRSLTDIFYSLNNCVDEALMLSNYTLVRESRGSVFLLNNMPLYENGDIESQLTMISRHITTLDMFKSAYLFLAEEPVSVPDEKSFRPFDSLYLEMFTEGRKSYINTHNPDEVKRADFFRCAQDSNRRRTVVLSSLFFRDEHFGLILCEIPSERMYFIQMVSMQISLIIKNANLISQLNYQNKILSSMASQDKLTGLLNKRGFNEEAEKLLSCPENRGKTALFIFADMDNLKLTNDNYGHEEGNFALIMIADTLRSCLGEDCVIGRTGGDEFNALMLLGGSQTPSDIRRSLRRTLAKLSDRSGKPYSVTMSVGLSIVICEADIDIDTYINAADNDMYDNKRSKPKSIAKTSFYAD